MSYRSFVLRPHHLLIVSLFTPALAAQVTVPGDFPDPQTAVDAVAPGTTIVVPGGTWPSLRVDKSITLLGHTAPTFDPDNDRSPGIRLDGPGSGSVVLANVRTEGEVGFIGSRAGQGIAGHGFDELHVIESHIGAAEFSGLTGLGYGGSGIETSVPFVRIERSYVQGSKTDIDATLTTFAPPAAPGVVAPADVLVLDSTIVGGPNGVYTWGDPFPPCPIGCPSGAGSPAVRCDTLYWANSLFFSGPGVQRSSTTPRVVRARPRERTTANGGGERARPTCRKER